MAQLDGCEEHARQKEALPLVDDIGLDASEKTILDIVRHLCRGLSVPTYDGLGEALARANVQWADKASNRIVESTIYLLAGVQAVRSRPFEFIVTDCPNCSKHICQSELHLMMMLRAGRHDDHEGVAGAAQLVAVSGPPNGLVYAAHRVVGVLKDYGAFTRDTSRVLH